MNPTSKIYIGILPTRQVGKLGRSKPRVVLGERGLEGRVLGHLNLRQLALSDLQPVQQRKIMLTGIVGIR